MIIVKYDSGVAFFNEDHYRKVVYDQEEKVVYAFQNSSNTARDIFINVESVAYTNEAQPTSLLFDSGSAADCHDGEGGNNQ